jgi:hypothetical protein
MKTEIKRVQVPVSLRTLIEITKSMPEGTTMRQDEDGMWIVFECDNAACTDSFGGGEVHEARENELVELGENPLHHGNGQVPAVVRLAWESLT